MKAKLGLFAAVLTAACSAFANRGEIWGSLGYQWLSDDGYWNVAGNWEENHIPTTFEASVFDKGGTVRIPASTEENPFTEGTLVVPRVQNFPYGDKLTIDGSNAFWLKRVVPGETFTKRTYMCLFDFGGYFWGGEGFNVAYADDDWYWYATNVVMTVERGPSAAEDGVTLTLKQGYLNQYDPFGHSNHGHNWIMFNTGRANAKVIYEEGTHTRVRDFSVRANGADNLFWIKGGLHEVYNNFNLKVDQNNNPANMRVSGGTFTVQSGNISLTTAEAKPAEGIKPTSVLTVDGTGEFRHDALNYWMNVGTAKYGAEATLRLADQAKATIQHCTVGNNLEAVGRIELSGDSSLVQSVAGHVMYVGRESGSVGVLSLTNNATAVLGQVRVGAEDNNNRARAYGKIALAGDSRLTISNSLYAARASYSTGIVEVAGNAVLSLPNGSILTSDVNDETNAYTRIEVTENGGLEHGNVYLCNAAIAAGNSADIVFGGHATNHVWQDNMNYGFVVGNSSNSVARATFKDDARVQLPRVYVGSEDNNQAKRTAKGVMTVEDNAYVSIGNNLWLGNVNMADALLEVKGGTLDLNNTQISVGCQPDATSRVQVTGGTVKAGKVLLGCANYGSGSSFEMTGGTMTASGDLIIGTNAGSDAEAHFGGTAKYEQTNGRIYVANGDNTTGRLLIDGNAEVTASLWLGSTSAATRNPTVDIKGNGTLNWKGEWIGLAPGHSLMTISENGTLNLAAASVTMGWSGRDGERPELVLKDNGRITGSGWINVGNNASSAATLRIEGGSIDSLTGLSLLTAGTNSLIEISGGDHRLNQIYAYQNNNFGAATTNTVRFSGGKTVASNWFVIGNDNQVGRVEIKGGEFQTREVNLGFGKQPTDHFSVLEISGGVLRVENVNGGDCRFQFGNGTGNASRGRLVMTGGEIMVMSMKGNHSADGRSEALFDGGAIVQIIHSHPTDALIQGITLAEVGATGLTIDSNGFNSYVSQAFTDALDGNGDPLEGRVTVTGDGSLDVRLDSYHALTVVDGGTLTFSNGATVFGRRTLLRNGGTFSLAGDATSFAFDSLTIGDATSAGVLKLDAGDTITITGADGLKVNNLVLDVSHITGNGTYAVFQTSGDGTIDPAKLGNVTLKMANPLKSYTLNDDGTVTVADRAFAETQWHGTQSSLWGNNDNWSANAPSGADSKALFGNVANKQVQTSSGASAGVLKFTAPNYVVDGSDAVSVDVAIDNQSTSGTVTMASPLAFGENVSIIGAEGSTTALSGALSGADVSLTKTGSGKVDISGNSPALDASWIVDGGTLEFSSPQAFGIGDGQLEVAAGTLAYSGSADCDTGKKLLVSAPSKRGAIVDVYADTLTVSNAEVQSGCLVKKGTGTLAIKYGEGTFQLDDTSVQTQNPGDNIAFAGTGDSPVSENMFSAVTVAEGRLEITGVGSNATEVLCKDGISIGDSYATAQENSELVLRNVRFNVNDGGRQFSVGRRTQGSCKEPWIKALDGTYVYGNQLVIGWDPNVQMDAGVAVTNAAMYFNDCILFAQGGNATAKVRVGPNGLLAARAYLALREWQDVLAEGENAVIGALSTNGRDDTCSWDGVCLLQNNNVRGAWTFRNGGTLRIGAHIHGANNAVNGTASNPGFNFVFDGGILDFLSGGTSVMAKPQYQGYRTEGAGMTVSVPAGSVHTLTTPIRGDGGVVKVGAGELVFADVRDFSGNWKNVNSKFSYEYNDLGYAIMLGQYEGATEVREGILTLYAGMLTNTTAVTVGEAGALNLGGNVFEFPSVAGSGVVSNGTLNAVIKVAMDSSSHTGEMPTFSDVVLPANQMFDFDFGDGAMELRVPYTLSRMGVSAGAMSGWKAVSGGRRAYPVFSVDSEGRAVVTLHSPPGTAVIVR